MIAAPFHRKVTPASVDIAAPPATFGCVEYPTHQMKVVGLVRERPTDCWHAADRLQRSLLKVRGGIGIHPKGVFRFKTHEELLEWTRKQKVIAATEVAARRSTT